MGYSARVSGDKQKPSYKANNDPRGPEEALQFKAHKFFEKNCRPQTCQEPKIYHCLPNNGYNGLSCAENSVYSEHNEAKISVRARCQRSSDER